MDDRTLAKTVAGGRIAFGIFMLLFPRALARRSGEGEVPSPPFVWWLRAFGIRDVVLGLGTFRALSENDGAAAARWVEMGAVADTADAVTAVVFRGDLGGRDRRGTLAIAVPAAAAGWKSLAGLRRG